MSYSRLEKFIYAICSMDVTDLPVPLSRIEKLWNCLITGETPDFEPLSRNEKYLMAMLDRYDISNLPAPMSRGEKLLYKIAVGETDLSDVPGYLSRYEELLKYLIENGGISGGDFEYVLYTLNQSMHTLYLTAEKPVKSAILSGCTKYTNDNGDVFDKFFTPIIVNWSSGYVYDDGTIADGGHYVTQFIDITGFDGFNFGIDETSYAKIGFYDENKTFISRSMGSENGTHGIVMSQTFPLNTKYIRASFTTKNVYFKDFYNRDLTLPLSLSNVKMPVLTTTGKNLLDINKLADINNHTATLTTSAYTIAYPLQLKPNTTYSISRETSDKLSVNLSVITIIDGSENRVSITGITNKSRTATTGDDGVLYLAVQNVDESNLATVINDVGYLQVEEASVATSYEPYKSNILHTPEEVVLRSLPNGVCDTLNLNTGEYVQRIDEVVLDGSESWYQEGQRYWTRLGGHIVGNTGKTDDNVLSNKYVFVPVGVLSGTDIAIGQCRWGKDQNFIVNQDNGSMGAASWETYLSQNPLTIQCQLATPIIKTVDLTIVDQDNQPTQLGTFENITHVSLEAENLIPEVEMEVATIISEELASASPLMDDISTEQQQLNTTVDEQSDNVDATMIATTEIFEETL